MAGRDGSETPRDERKRRFEEEVPPPRILKLALLAAAIIVIIALILYFKARQAPPALKDQLRMGPSPLYARNDSPRPNHQRIVAR